MTKTIAPPDADKLLDAMKTGASEVLDILLACPTEFWSLKKPPEGGSSAADIASDVNIRAVTFGQNPLKALGLLDVKRLEILPAVVGSEVLRRTNS